MPRTVDLFTPTKLICFAVLAVTMVGCRGNPQAISSIISSEEAICFFDLSTLGNEQEGDLKMLNGSILPLKTDVEYAGPQGKILRRVLHTYDESIEEEQLVEGINRCYSQYDLEVFPIGDVKKFWRIETLNVSISLRLESNEVEYLWTALTD